MQAILVLILFLALLIAVFTLQNATLVPIRLLFWQFDVSLVLIILGSAFTGGLGVLLAGLFRSKKRAASATALVAEEEGTEPVDEAEIETAVENVDGKTAEDEEPPESKDV